MTATRRKIDIATTSPATITTTSSATTTHVFSGTAASAVPDVLVHSRDVLRARSKLEAGIEGAVYSHIRAVRALGRTSITSLEVSRALNLPIHVVDEALRRLAYKGVKLQG